MPLCILFNIPIYKLFGFEIQHEPCSMCLAFSYYLCQLDYDSNVHTQCEVRCVKSTTNTGTAQK